VKRLNLLVFGVFLLNFSVFAQIGGTTQRGMATHQMDSEGFFAAHNSFPLGSTIKVVNTRTGKGIDAVINGRISVSPKRVIDLSRDAWNALELTEGTVVMIVYTPPPVVRPSPAAIEPQTPEPAAAEISREEINIYETARLKPTQPLYHLLIIDRRNCEENSDISDLQDIKLLYKFPHDKKGYLVVLYVSSTNTKGPVFPVMPDKSRILVDLMTTDLAFIRDYTNSSPFKRFVTNKQALSELRMTLK
jgi:hypothetical protein